MDGEVFHYRDKYGVEADAIVQFCEQIDTQGAGEPAFFYVAGGSVMTDKTLGHLEKLM